MRLLRNLIKLYMMAVGLRRYGAIRALSRMTEIPAWLPRLLRFSTFYIPRRLHLPDNEGERLALALSKMGTAYIKLGQTLATRPDLVSRPVAEGLATLQDRLPAFSFKKVQQIIADELGGAIGDHYKSFEEEPVAAASIAQVHKAVTSDGQQVAVKVVRPDVRERFLSDLKLFDWLASEAEKHSAEGRRLRLIQVVDKLRETVLREMDLRLEAAAAAELADNMKGHAGYRVPAIDWDRTAEKVLTLEWVDGIRLADKDKLVEAGHDLPALASTIVRTFLTQALTHGYFHADLHQGNLIIEPDGTIAAIDFGIMGRLSKRERRFLAEILFGFVRRDYRRVAEVHFDAGYVPEGESLEEFTQAMHTIADPIMDLPINEVSAGKLLAQLFATTERFNMHTQPQLLILQRSMVMAEGMALHLDDDANMWDISGPLLEDWVRNNLSPEVLLADFIRDLPRNIERLPSLMDKWLSDDTKSHTQSTPTVTHVSGPKLWPFALGMVTGAAILKILTM